MLSQNTVERLKAYARTSWNAGRKAGGSSSLDLVLVDGRVDDAAVKSCCVTARRAGDAEGAALGKKLLALSPAERGAVIRAARSL